jgi:integrase
VARVHTNKKSREAWPDHVVSKLLASPDQALRLAVSLLVHTGQREGDVIRMKWADIRDDEIFVVQEKTGTRVWIPLHRDLRVLLDQTPHVSDSILNSSLGRPFSSSQALYEKIKTALRKVGEGGYVPHGLRANAAVRLVDAGCTEDQAAAITGHRDMNVLRGYLRSRNQVKLARQAIRKLEAAR